MNDQPDTSFLARLLGQNWKTTIGGTLSAAGGVLATQTTGKWQIAGGIMLAVGLQWMGVMARDKGVSSAQMDAAGSGQPIIPQAKLPGSLLILLVGMITMLAMGSVRADTNGFPMLYAVQSAALETHHGDMLRSSGVGAITHVGVDYGDWAIESVLEIPLYQTQQHTRRSVGVDLLLKPWAFGNFEPFAVAGAGYYWGSDPLQCLAADVGVGCRFHVSRWVFLQLDARDAVPYDGRTLVVPARFQVVSIGLGASY